MENNLWQPIPTVRGRLYQQVLHQGLSFKYEYIDISADSRSPLLLFGADLRLVYALSGQTMIEFANSQLALNAKAQHNAALLPVIEGCYGHKHLIKQTGKRELVIFISLQYLRDTLNSAEFAALEQILYRDLQCVYFHCNALMRQLLARLCSPQLTTMSKIRQKILLLTIVDYSLQQITSCAQVAKQNLSEHRLQSLERLNNLMHNGLLDHYTIKDMAKFCASNPTTLQKTFKQHFGISLGAQRRKIMLARAYDALLAGSSVCNAAQLAGYNHLQSFSKAFMREYQCLPRNIKG